MDFDKEKKPHRKEKFFYFITAGLPHRGGISVRD